MEEETYERSERERTRSTVVELFNSGKRTSSVCLHGVSSPNSSPSLLPLANFLSLSPAHVNLDILQVSHERKKDVSLGSPTVPRRKKAPRSPHVAL